MSEPQAAPPAAPAAPAETGFFGRAVEHIEHAGHAAVTHAVVPAAEIHAHAAQVFSVAGDLLPLLAALDPAAAPAVAAGEVLLPKVLGLVTSAAGLIAAAHKPAA